MARNRWIILLFGLLYLGCQDEPIVNIDSRFTLLPADSTQVFFSNELTYDRQFNIYTYRNFYNGGGIAIGDFNNDGLEDLFFTANMASNRMYLNQGGFLFKDVTDQAGIGGEHGWSTGVSVADVNADGWLDIYVCNSGDLEGDNKQNELYLHRGLNADSIPIFEEVATTIGLADQGYGTHAAFFDYDRDGDLDVYLLNNSYRSIFDFNLMKNQRPVRDEKGGDKLYRNEGGFFLDVSEEAGIYGSEIGFGLGVTVGDVDRDGWLDIFVSNDFFERDYLYINNGDGTFTEELENQIQSLSVASMGADIADLTNDGYPEIFVTEMLPEDEARFKTKMTFESWDRYQYNVANGYYHQFTRNVLQLNHGDGTFSEVGRLAGVEATDWSWGALIADFDNDGLSDLFVANGLYKDIIDQDYINFVSNEEIVKQVVSAEGVNYQKLIDTIPSNPIPNYLFRNRGNLQFENVAESWGLATPSHSNGAAYADLDNDGDLDLVVNNVNAPAFIYRNETNRLEPDYHYLKIILHGSAGNVDALGANVTLKVDGQVFYLEKVPIRGFQSSVDQRLNFGLGPYTTVDTMIVRWPDRRTTLLTNIPTNQTISLQQDEAQGSLALAPNAGSQSVLFTEITDSVDWGYRHIENSFVDFDRDRLIYHMLSTQGPNLDVGDANGDGLEDFYIGGATNTPGGLFTQRPDGGFTATNRNLFMQDRGPEDVDGHLFDADADGDQDLYVCRGGNEHLLNSNLLVDQLYLNDGTARLQRSAQYLPTFKFESSSCVKSADYDGDGDLDLFVGIRLIPAHYGYPTQGYILDNNGQGQFRNVTDQVASELIDLGMITDLEWVDIDGDEDQDIVVVGEWLPITIFENINGRFTRKENTISPNKTAGWWNCIKSSDLDDDGDIDLVIGNHGLNSRFSASAEKPISLHVSDFDGNGTPEPIISQYNGEVSYPLTLRHDLVMQLPELKKKYQLYHNYKEQTVNDIFSEEQLSASIKKEAYLLESVVLLNDGKGKFTCQALPLEAQYAPIYAILIEDFDRDGSKDLLLGGNLYGAKPEVGRYDASFGVFLKGNGQGDFTTVSGNRSGFKVRGQIRDLEKIKVAGQDMVLVGMNNSKMRVYTY